MSMTWPAFGAALSGALQDSWKEFCKENRLDPHDESNFPMWVQHIALIANFKPGQPITVSVSVRARAGKSSEEYFYNITRNGGQPKLFRDQV
jgi:hypothetical protein